MKYACILLMMLSAWGTAPAQSTVSGSLSTRVDSLINAMPSGEGTNQYAAPNSSQLSQWGSVISKILQRDYPGANTSASSLGYELIQFTDTTTNPRVTYYILEKNTSSTNYWGTYFFNPSPQRPKIVIASPHELYDMYTGKQGRQIFMRTGARAFFLNGTHRCNSASFSSCSGTTTACNSTAEHYRVSDQAHNVSGMFQKTTEILRLNITNMVLIQNHGFSKDTGDPSVIMSNGTRTTPSTDYLVSLRDNLLALDATLTFKIAHIDLSWTKLVATENTQGRLINGSSSPCSNDAASGNGRFLHVEQCLTGLRDSENNRRKLSDAIAATFPADALTLTAPNGGELWAGGSVQTIAWTKAGLIDNVKLEYTIDNGSHWSVISASTSNTGTYAWTLPMIGAWRARVRITDVANSATSDVSNGLFRMTAVLWPISNSTTPDPIAAGFGSRLLSGVYDFHRGIDLPNVLNTPVHPVAPGVVARREDTTETKGTSLERNGNWILVKNDPESGQPRHTAYLHLNGFSHYQVGDTVSTADTIAFMGKSGVGINTIHTHLEYYKNLAGTAINKDKAMNPMEILNFSDGNAYTIVAGNRSDSAYVEVGMTEPELDFDEIVIYGKLATRTVSFNARVGIDPSNNDNPRYHNVLIDPIPFTIDSTVRRIRFWVKTGETGELDSAKMTDARGYSTVVSFATMRYAISSGSWDGAIWAADPGGAAGSASVPSRDLDVSINDGVVVDVTTNNAECNSISFGGEGAQLQLGSGARLSVYGDFTLASTAHQAFASWAPGAKLRFSGSAKQTLRGWSTGSSGDVNTTLMEVQVDKDADTLRTPGTDMRVAIGTSLEILHGSFLLDSADDLDGKTFDGSSPGAPMVSVASTGAFVMKGGDSHIRSGSSGASPIGAVSISGTASFVTTSSVGINLESVLVGQGGLLIIPATWAANTFGCGTATISAGGVLLNSATTDIWGPSAQLILQHGGEFRTMSATTVFPASFTNLGTVHYAGTGVGYQYIADRDYARLEVSASGNNKLWTITAPREIADSLEVNGNASLVIAATAPQTLTVNRTLRLTDGSLNDSDPEVNLVLADGALISRGTGTLSSAPAFGMSVDLMYTNTGAGVATGPEAPADPTVLRDLTVQTGAASVTLGSNLTVNRILWLRSGSFNNGSKTLTVANHATIVRAGGLLTAAPVFAGKANLWYAPSTSVTATSVELPHTPGVIDTLIVENSKNVALEDSATVTGNLRLLKGSLFLNSNELILDTAATVSGSPGDSTMIVTNGAGSLKKLFGSVSDFTFPVGDTVRGYSYTPLSVSFVAGECAPGSALAARTVSSKHPQNFSVTNFLRRYWIAEGTGFTGDTMLVTARYAAGDVVGLENELHFGALRGPGWLLGNPAVPGLHEISGVVDTFTSYSGLPVTQATAIRPEPGWNMVSVPLAILDMTMSSLFPGAVSAAFAYERGYKTYDTLRNGVGYWIKFGDTTSFLLSGTAVGTDTVDVVPGWNMIGPLSAPVLVGSIVPVGTAIQSQFFGFNGTYFSEDTLSIGHGYWVKVSSIGKLRLPALAEPPRTGRELPPTGRENLPDALDRKNH